MTDRRKKKGFYTELAYLFGILLLSFATAMMSVGGFGMSVVVAPAYLLYLFLSQFWGGMTFGLAEYILQGMLLLLTIAVMRKCRLSYLLSFLTALFYGACLDGWMRLATLFPAPGLAVRIVLYAAGTVLCAVAISLLFHTYLPLEVYELFVKEVTDAYHKNLTVVKTVYDCCSFLLAVLLSFVFFGFGKFEGIGWGTLVCALLNGWLIGRFSVLWEKHFVFYDRFRRRPEKRDGEDMAATEKRDSDSAGAEKDLEDGGAT